LDIVVGGQLAGLQDHLEPDRPAGILDGRDLVEHLAVVAGQERATVDHHVHLGGAGVDGEPGVGQFDR